MYKYVLIGENKIAVVQLQMMYKGKGRTSDRKNKWMKYKSMRGEGA
jgi:hypothetical protein